VSFRREKGQARGGPNGGRGGEGGSVFLEASRRVQTLVQCKQTVHVRASHGKNGQGKMKNGVAGNDVVIQVPLGTIARELSTQRVAAELALDGQRLLVARGGRGGRGNAAFQTHCRTAPKLCEKGAPGASRWLELELRLLAEVGFLGLPNAGKSTLLAATSAATPKIANYPFTTLIPHLGVCNLPHHHPAEGMVLCDIPGLIPGASQGAGMGLHFLRHVQRCKVLLHVLDGSSDDVVANFHALQNELSLYDPVVLARKPQVIVVNKLDLPEVDERKEDLLQQLREASGHSRVVAISAATMQGVPELFMRLSKLVAAEEAAAKLQTSEPGTVDTADVLDRALLVKERPAEKVPEISFEKTGLDFPPDDFSLESDPSYPGQWRIKGEYIEAVAQMTHWEYPEALERFGRQLEAIGVADALIRRGAKEGDLIMIDKYDFDFSPGRTNPYIPAELLEQEQDHFATSSKKRVQSNDDEAQNSWRPFTQGGYLDMDVSELSGFAEERGESEELDGSWDDLFRLDGEIHEGEFLLDDQDDIWMS
jgi:GTP-binding protein